MATAFDFWLMATGSPPIPDTVKRLAVICPSWVGDTVMATPVLRAVRTTRPDTHVTVVCRPGLDEVLAGCPWIDDIVAVDMKRIGGTVQSARRLRHARVDAVLLLPNGLRSAVVAALAGVRIRVGYKRAGRGPLLSHCLASPPGRGPIGAVDYYASLAKFALGLEHVDTRMQLAVTDAQRAEADRLLDAVPRPFVVLCPGANRKAKRWPVERFAAVADELATRHGLAVVATGSPTEQSVVAAIKPASRTPVLNLIDRGVTLGALKGVIAEARLMISNDTGPRHIAAALGTPTVSLFGPTDPRWTTIDSPCEKILLAEPFLPAELVADDCPTGCVIERITVGDVLSAAGQLLSAAAVTADASRDASPAATPPEAPGRH
jgi:heptosyltransferase-2